MNLTPICVITLHTTSLPNDKKASACKRTAQHTNDDQDNGSESGNARENYCADNNCRVGRISDSYKITAVVDDIGGGGADSESRYYRELEGLIEPICSVDGGAGCGQICPQSDGVVSTKHQVRRNAWITLNSSLFNDLALDFAI